MTLSNPVGRPPKYSFSKMQSGDKQFFPLETGRIESLQNRLQTSAIKHGKFKTRRVMSNGVLGVVVVAQ